MAQTRKAECHLGAIFQFISRRPLPTGRAVGQVSEVSGLGSGVQAQIFLLRGCQIELPDRKPLTSLITLTGFDDLTGCLQAIGG